MSMSEIDRSRLLSSMVSRLSGNELQDLFRVLDVDYRNLPGSNRAAKARELIAYMDRMGRMPELLYAIDNKRPDIFTANTATTPTTSTTSTPGVEAASLIIELASLRQQLVELQKGSLTDEHIENRIKEILRTADRAVGQSEELNAKLLLPPSELTDVPLVPIHLLNRLEEHRSDESAAFFAHRRICWRSPWHPI